jgi:hypothetical protein
VVCLPVFYEEPQTMCHQIVDYDRTSSARSARALGSVMDFKDMIRIIDESKGVLYLISLMKVVVLPPNGGGLVSSIGLV